MNMTGNPNKYLWMVDSPRVMLSLMQKYQARCSSVKSNASYDMPTTRFLSNIIQTLSQKRRKSGDTLFSRAYNLQPQPMINPGHSQWSYHSHVAQLEQEGMPEWASSASAEFHLGSRGWFFSHTATGNLPPYETDSHPLAVRINQVSHYSNVGHWDVKYTHQYTPVSILWQEESEAVGRALDPVTHGWFTTTSSQSGFWFSHAVIWWIMMRLLSAIPPSRFRSLQSRVATCKVREDGPSQSHLDCVGHPPRHFSKDDPQKHIAC